MNRVMRRGQQPQSQFVGILFRSSQFIGSCSSSCSKLTQLSSKSEFICMRQEFDAVAVL